MQLPYLTIWDLEAVSQCVDDLRRNAGALDAIVDIPDERKPPDLGWWVIRGNTLLNALHRAHQGEDPELIYLELHANASHEDYRSD